MVRGTMTRMCVGAVIAAATMLAFAGGASAAATQRIVRVNPMTPGAARPMQPLGRVSNDVVTSTNWSGYAVEDASQFTEVTGSWVQPAVTCNSKSAQYASFWAGIDGYSSSSVEQLGTDSDCVGRNRPSYYAWYEMYPAFSVNIPTSTYPVAPGDTLTATVSVSGSTFTLSLSSSRGWNFSIAESGPGLAQSSAELIAESPEICTGSRCSLAQLSNFGSVNFTGADAAVNGGALAPFGSYTGNAGPHEIVGVTRNGTVRAQPSALFSAGSAFSIAWKHS